MQQKFGEYGFYQMTVVIPKKPMLSVVEGAALMALTDYTYIRARKLKYTYGIRVSSSKERAKARGISDDYINNKANIDREGRVRGCFGIVAVKNERVSIGDIKTHLSYRGSMTATESRIAILKCDKLKPKIASEGKELAVLLLSHTDLKKKIVTEFHFYGTIFKVYSYPKSNPDDKQQVDIKYVN
eukprot:515028_1